MNRPSALIPALLALTTLVLAGCNRPDSDAALRTAFETGVQTFLADGHDALCLGMHDWPIDLTEAEAGAKSRHAVQLPVFEQLGLATSTFVAVPRSTENPDGAIKRYALTDEGRKYYLAHASTSRDGAAHPYDFCVARISVARIDNWELDTQDAQHPTAVVNYSYRIESAPWMSDPDAQRVLPMVAKLIKGADGGLQMHQRFARGDHGWVAVAGPA